jgi:hypothetical protein
MAIRASKAGITHLRTFNGPTATSITKEFNYNSVRPIAGVDMLAGFWQAAFVQLPAGFSGAGASVMMGATAFTSPGAFAVATAHGIRVAGPSSGAAANRTRAGFTSKGPANEVDVGLDLASPLPPLVLGRPYLFIWGANHLEHLGSPQWRGWLLTADTTTGAIVCSVDVDLPAAGWLSGTSTQLLRHIFLAEGTAADRTQLDTIIEHVCLVNGEFPWDTLNDPTAGQTGVGRPHYDAVHALLGRNTSGPLPAGQELDYGQLVQAQNAGTLTYANLVAGRGNLDHWWTLENLTAGLVNRSFTNKTLTLVQQNFNGDVDGLADIARISPAHFRSAPVAATPPVITPLRQKFFGGRGLLPCVVSGTHTGNVERRWVLAGTGTPVAGFDWAVRTATGGAWSTSDVLPPGNYDLQVRDVADGSLLTALNDILVGTKLLMHGQSGMALSLFNGPLNPQNIPVASGAQGLFVDLLNDNAGTGGYARPTFSQTRMVGGTTPAQPYCAILMLNEWNTHNPGHPLFVGVMAVAGTFMADWANNSVVEGGNWTFLGAVGEPGPSSAGTVGLVGYWAWLLDQQIDGHMMMWHPNFAGAATGSGSRDAYRDAIDGRFVHSTSEPWMFLPSWRTHVASPQVGTNGIQVWNRAALFADQLGARGYLGPQWTDIVSEKDNDLHPAFDGVGSLVSDANHIGAGAAARGHGRAAARLFNQDVNAIFRLGGVWTDNACATLNVELGRKGRTLNGAAIAATVFWFSTDNGVTWTRGNGTNFTAAFDATATRVVLTAGAGVAATWEAARAAGNLRIDYAREWPFDFTVNANEANSPALLEGLIYDSATYRGRKNLTPAAGNVLQGTVLIGAGVAGVPVTVKGNPKLVTTERMSGNRSVTVRMRRVSDDAVLATRTLNLVTAS